MLSGFVWTQKNKGLLLIYTGVVLTCGIHIAYAVYFDHKRQTDPEFRKTLKKNNRKMARAVKEEAEAQGAAQREAITKAVQQAKDEGFPTDLEEKEAYFMGQVARGESLCTEGMCCPRHPHYWDEKNPPKFRMN